jgi:hypothetical protein
MSTALQQAGELTSSMASKLPNWYSSKQGLTCESPAVFGAGGLALSQAGESLEPGRSVHSRLGSCASDLAFASCHFEPIGELGSVDFDAACGALETLLFREEDMDHLLQHAASCFQACSEQFVQYGHLLCAEDHATTDNDSSAGCMLMQAGQQLRVVGEALLEISTVELARALQEEEES